MLILAFDTTAAACSVALWRDGTILKAEHEAMKQGQAEALVPMIERTLKKCDVDYAALDRFAVTVGPGSFTGVRVGISTGRALGLAANKPVIGVKTTEVLAAAAPEKGARILAVIDTKRGDLYAQLFDPGLKPPGNIQIATPQTLPQWIGPKPVTLVGDAAATAANILGSNAVVSSANPLPDVATLAQIASMREPSAQDLVPAYARAPDAVRPKAGGRLRP
jgi:tRNA threonylcarbamoyladenosine biosynthesis protein TsaB